MRASPVGPTAILAAGGAALCILLLLPLLLVDVPPLLDYPNHLARLVVLADAGRDPVLARFYTPHWAIIPDLGIDVIGIALLHILPVHVAGRVLIGLALLLPILGTLAYGRVVLGRSLWPLLCGLVAFNGTLLLGFLNFSLASGLALLLAAAWLAWREAHPVRILLLAIPGATALFFCHLMGLLFFAVLIGAHEAAALASRRTLSQLVQRIGLLALVFAIPVSLYAVCDLRDMAGDASFLSPVAKAAQLAVPFTNYHPALDAFAALATFATLAACAITGHLRLPLRAGLAVAALALLYLAAPFGYKGTYSLDTRFAIMLGFMLFCGMAPSRLPPRVALGLGSALALLFLLRLTLLADAWQAHNQDLAELRMTIASVQPGDIVYLTTVTPEEAPRSWQDGLASRRLSNGIVTDTHTAALLLIEHHAWWPFLFDNPSQQPIETRPRFRALAQQTGGTRPHRAMTRGDLCGFDHLLLLDAGGEPDLQRYAATRGLRVVAASPYAALFAVEPNPACPR